MSTHLDVTVIVAGFSGNTASPDVSDLGFSVVVLKDGERLGGRTTPSTYPRLDRVGVDFVGRW